MMISKTKSQDNQQRKEQMLQFVDSYLNSRKCRRQFILSYFEGKPVPIEERPNCCDICSKRSIECETDHKIYCGVNEDGKFNFTEDAKMFLKLMTSIKYNLGIGSYISLLRGSKQKQLTKYFNNPYYGCGKEKSEIWWKEIGMLLTKHGHITSKFIQGYVSVVEVAKKGKQFLTNDSSCLKDIPTSKMTSCLAVKGNIWIDSKPHSSFATASSSNAKILITSSDTNEEKAEVEKLYKALLEKRLQLAQKENCMPYMIASNKALLDMAEQKPKNIDEMQRCQFDGMTAIKLVKYGREFLEVTLPFMKQVSKAFQLSNQSNVSQTSNRNIWTNNKSQHSSEALLNMDSQKPISSKEMEGSQFTSSSHPSIKQVLSCHPLPKQPKLSSAMITSFDLNQSGQSLMAIAKIRNVTLGTIQKYVYKCMMNGYPVKLSTFGVTKEIAYLIMDAIGAVETGLELLKPIKMGCPDEIDYEHIRAMVSYLKIREHLDILNLPYDDFEEVNYYVIYKSEECKQVENDKMDNILILRKQSVDRDSNITQLINALKEIEDIGLDALDDYTFESSNNEDYEKGDANSVDIKVEQKHTNSNSSELSGILDSQEPEPKRFKTRKSVLDSPENQLLNNVTDSQNTEGSVAMDVAEEKEANGIQIENSTNESNFGSYGRQVSVECISGNKENQKKIPVGENKNLNLPLWLTNKKYLRE